MIFHRVNNGEEVDIKIRSYTRIGHNGYCTYIDNMDCIYYVKETVEEIKRMIGMK